MKFFKQLIITVFASCVFAVSAMAFEPQKNDQKPPPPKKQPQEVPKAPKENPPPRNNNTNDKGNKGEGKKGGKP